MSSASDSPRYGPKGVCDPTRRPSHVSSGTAGHDHVDITEDGRRKATRKKIIPCAKKVRVFRRVVITFLFSSITPCFYALSDLL